MKPYRPDGEDPWRTPDEILDWVYERGQALRIRRRISRGVAAAAALSVVVAIGVIGLGDPEPRGIRIVDSPSSEPSFEPGTPTPTPSPSAFPVSPTPEQSPTLVCHNSTDPACGDFYWDPPPGPDAPLEFEIQISPANPQVGQEVTVTVTVRDPDSPLYEIHINFDVAMKFTTLCAPRERYGPWSPPEKEPGEMTKTATHTFDAPGDHYVHVLARSQGASCGSSPYGSNGESQRTIVVAPEPSPTPTDTGLLPTP